MMGWMVDDLHLIDKRMRTVAKCSDSQTSRHLRTNIVPTPLTFGENIAPATLTIPENVLTFG
jgi:hypothetical protein